MNNREYLQKGLDRLGLELPAERLDTLLCYSEELQKWSRRINLIAKGADEQTILEVHFLDSLTLLPVLCHHGPQRFSLLDVGSGAGFPGLVLAAVLPGHGFTLVEPRTKRVTFLRHMVRVLGLENVLVLTSRVEDAPLPATGSYDYITGRAVADPEKFMTLLGGLLTPATRVILMLAGRKPLEQLLHNQPHTYTCIEERAVRLPFSGAGRLLAVLATR